MRKKSAGVLGGVAASIKDLVADLSNVFLLYSDLNHLGHNFDDALRSLAYVEHCVPKIVSALEMLQSIVQIILKAVQGVSFPPNPAVIVDLSTTRSPASSRASSSSTTAIPSASTRPWSPGSNFENPRPDKTSWFVFLPGCPHPRENKQGRA